MSNPSTLPTPDVLTALKTRWDASSATLSTIAGPYRDCAPAKATPAVPYCVVIAGMAMREKTTSSHEFWLVSVEFALRSTTQELAQAAALLVASAFDDFIPTLAAGKGVVLSVRRTGDRNAEEDRQVHAYTLVYQYQVEVARMDR